jgi:hypothetical protein
MQLQSTTFVLAAVLAMAPCTAKAAYCGPPSQTAIVEQQAIRKTSSHPAFDRSRVMNIMVDRGYAVANIEYAGVLTQYFKRIGTRWTFAGYTLPANLPAAVAQKFRTLPASPNTCGNPHFVNHASGA